jgi:hypothetical protein
VDGGGAVLILVAGIAGVVVIGRMSGVGPFGQETYLVEHTDYQSPPTNPDDVLTDDQLEDRPAPAFDPALADRRPLGHKGAWLLNASAAVVRAVCWSARENLG